MYRYDLMNLLLLSHGADAHCVCAQIWTVVDQIDLIKWKTDRS